MSDSLMALYFFDGVPDDWVEETVVALVEAGFTTTPEGRTDTVDYYTTERRGQKWIPPAGTRVSTAVEEIEEMGGGLMHVYYDRVQLTVEFNPYGDEDLERQQPLVTMHGDINGFTPEATSKATARDRAEKFVDGIAAVSARLDPWYVFAAPWDDRETWGANERVWPAQQLPEGGVDTIPWVATFGHGWFDRFGGRERLVETPAWDVRSLDSGHVVIQTRDLPNLDDVHEPSPLSVDRYLLDGVPAQTLQAERDGERPTHVDPFRDLDDGELASDVLVCQEHVDFELPELHYGYVPGKADIGPCALVCCRRDGNVLRDAQTGEFVRRLVDEAGTPIGDLPDDADPEHELVSQEVGTESRTPHSVETLRMDGPDDESLLMSVFGIVDSIEDRDDDDNVGLFEDVKLLDDDDEITAGCELVEDIAEEE